MVQIKIFPLLKENKYESCVNSASTIFAQASDIVFSRFGEKIKEAIIKHLSSISKINAPQSFPYYSITKEAFCDLFTEEETDLILESIKKEMLERIDFVFSGTLIELLNEIQRRDIAKYLKNLSGHEHILFLWSDRNLRDKIMKDYFIQPNSPQSLMCSEKISLPEVSIAMYSDVLEDREVAIDKERQMVIQSHQENLGKLPTRLAGTDCTQWIKHGLSQEFFALEKELDEYFKNNNISCICGYNTKEIPDNKTLKILLKSHDYVMLDRPYSLFKQFK